MGLYNSLTRHVLAPTYDLLRGTRTMRCLAQLEESQWWSHEQLEEIQSRRLQSLIHHAHANVPYYRRLMDEHGIRPGDITSPSDLQMLPPLTKELIRANSAELLADGYPRAKLLEGHTGGSSGTPLNFHTSRDGRLTHGLARSLRAGQWAGVYPGDRTIHVTKRRLPGTEPEGFLPRLSRLMSREVFVDCTSFSEETLPAVVEKIAKSHPRALRGYTSAICIIADHIRESGKPAPEVGNVLVGGEQLFAEQREMLNNVFGRQPFSGYSSFENFAIAMECEAHEGMHINAEDLLVEIVDDNGRRVPAGSRGRLLVTNLHEYGMPLIRYDTDDESAFTGRDCACGRHLPLIEGVVGKTGNTIYTPSGKRLSPLTLGSSNLAPMGICRFQFVQETLDHVVVRIVPGSSLAPDEVAALPTRVSANFGRVLGADVHIDVVVVDRIEPTPAGKHLFLISKVAPVRK